MTSTTTLLCTWPVGTATWPSPVLYSTPAATSTTRTRTNRRRCMWPPNSDGRRQYPAQDCPGESQSPARPHGSVHSPMCPGELSFSLCFDIESRASSSYPLSWAHISFVSLWDISPVPDHTRLIVQDGSHPFLRCDLHSPRPCCRGPGAGSGVNLAHR